MDPPPSPSSDSSLQSMLDTIMTIQTAHGQILLDVLTKLQALQVDLVSTRGFTLQPPPLMMSHDCPLAIRHKKGEYILMEIGEDLAFLEL